MKIVFLFIFLFLMVIFSNQHVKSIVTEKNINDHVLHDIIHDKFYDLSSYYILSDIFCILLVFGFLIYIGFYKKDWQKIYIFIVMSMILYIFKYTIHIVTIYPDPYKHECKNRHNNYLKWIVGDCNHSMFSGHLALMMLITFFLYQDLNIITNVILWIYIFGTGILTIACKNHYTSDVFMSFFVVYFIYHFFYDKI